MPALNCLEDNDMLPNPLHPAVVHFPIVLMLFLPPIAAFVLWRLHDGARLRTWGWVVLTAAMVVGSGVVAKETGEDQEDRVEQVVPEAALHEHEEAADVFVLAAWIVLGLSLAGFAPGIAGRSARLLTLAGTLALAYFGVRVGDLGGKLVYQHGAASAYVTDTVPPGTPSLEAAEEGEDR
jgi:uncharacterized membrane protein